MTRSAPPQRSPRRRLAWPPTPTRASPAWRNWPVSPWAPPGPREPPDRSTRRTSDAEGAPDGLAVGGRFHAPPVGDVGHDLEAPTREVGGAGLLRSHGRRAAVADGD